MKHTFTTINIVMSVNNAKNNTRIKLTFRTEAIFFSIVAAVAQMPFCSAVCSILLLAALITKYLQGLNEIELLGSYGSAHLSAAVRLPMLVPDGGSGLSHGELAALA